MDISYVFVLAAAIAVFVNVINYKVSMDAIKEIPENKEKVQGRFFLILALSEIIPIILIIYGFTNLETVSALQDLYVPGLLVLVLIGFSALFIILQRIVGVPKDIKAFAKSFSNVALATTMSIPIIAIIAMVTMIP